ncbi:MAG: RNA methyltransferase [Pseudomonadota bacterium]
MAGRENPRPGRVQEITAVSNPRIKSIRALGMKKNRDQSRTFIAEGMKLVRDAFENGWTIDTLIYASSFKAQNPDLEGFAANVRARGADILEVNEKVLASITRRDNPQMVVGVMQQQWVEPPKSADDPETVWIGLDRVRDPGNLGTIIRTADAAGADGIILIGETTDPYSVEATRASMGSIFNIDIARFSNDAFSNWRKQWPGTTIGTHLEGAVDYRKLDYHQKPVLLLMGNEQQGLPDELSKECDHLIYIPMSGAADSLNLAIATGVMLFHMGKRLPKQESKNP